MRLDRSQRLTAPRLVRTPGPKAYESLRGYILRLSETNGYESPLIILRGAHITEADTRTTRIPLAKLAAIVGRDTSDFDHLRYVHPDVSRYGKDHRLNGVPVQTAALDTNSGKICVQCAKEQGYISPFWELKYAIACPKHGVPVVSSCPSCGNRLTWKRRGLLTCKCGARLDQHGLEKIDDVRILGLLEIVARRLTPDPQDVHSISAGFPVKHLQRMQLKTLLGVIERLGRLAREPARVGNSSPADSIRAAAHALAPWPQAFNEFLRRYGESSCASTPGNISFRRQFGRLLGSLFRSGLPTDEVGFLKDACDHFAARHWLEGALNLGTEDGR